MQQSYAAFAYSRYKTHNLYMWSYGCCMCWSLLVICQACRAPCRMLQRRMFKTFTDVSVLTICTVLTVLITFECRPRDQWVHQVIPEHQDYQAHRWVYCWCWWGWWWLCKSTACFSTACSSCVLFCYQQCEDTYKLWNISYSFKDSKMFQVVCLLMASASLRNFLFLQERPSSRYGFITWY